MSASTHRLTVGADHAGARLDVFISEFTDISRSQVRRLIADGQVQVDAAPAAKTGQKLSENQQVVVIEPAPESPEALPQEIPLAIVYEDRDVIVINKAAGMVVHPAAGNPDGTLVNALLHHCTDLQGVGGQLRPGIVHRIDKDTSGLLVVAKNDAAHQALSAQFKDHSITRTYHAFVFGAPEPASGRTEGNIARHPHDRKRFTVSEDRGKSAITHYKTLATYGEISYIELTLETGRTHQIRVHMAHLGHPVVGDPVYSTKRRVTHLRDMALRQQLAAVSRQLLHAKTLGFIHPASGEYLQLDSPLPTDMDMLLQWLNS